MKRRNADVGKLRRPMKRGKISDGFYASTFLYVKFLVVWALVLLADFLLEFRFEFLWPFWLLIHSVYDSFKYQGFAFSLLFVCIAIFSDVVCYLVIPVQWLFFVASTYVWVQYVCHTGDYNRGICLPTVTLWLLFVLYIEGTVRLKPDSTKTSPLNVDLGRPFAAHCIGYPVVTLGFGFKSYITYKLRLRKQKEVQKENDSYMQILRDALPPVYLVLEKEKVSLVSTIATTAMSSVTTTIAVSRTTRSGCSSSSSSSSSSSPPSPPHSSGHAPTNTVSCATSSISSPAIASSHTPASLPHSTATATVTTSATATATTTISSSSSHSHSSHKHDCKERSSSGGSGGGGGANHSSGHAHSNSTGGGANAGSSSSASNNTSKDDKKQRYGMANGNVSQLKKGKLQNGTSNSHSHNKDDSLFRMECELKKMRSDLQITRNSEHELRHQLSSNQLDDRLRRAELSQLRADNNTLQSKYDSILLSRDNEKHAVCSLERQLSEERRHRSTIDAALVYERQKSSDSEAAYTAMKSAKQECNAACKKRVSDFDRDLSSLKESLAHKTEELNNKHTQLLESKNTCKELESQVIHSNTNLNLLQEKFAHIENSLSSETRLKMDLFSALGEAKRQLEFETSTIIQKNLEIENLQLKISQVLALTPLHNSACDMHPVYESYDPHPHSPALAGTRRQY